MKLKRMTHQNCLGAFTRLELTVCLATLSIAGGIALPGLSNTRSRSQRAACVDNLRLIGEAVQLWAVDHGDMAPWEVRLSEGGTKPDTLPPYLKVGAAWYEFAWMSNQLVTPKILVCPEDARRAVNVAENWGKTGNGGYLNSGYRNNATSYCLNLHSFFSEPNIFLAGDRNLQVDNPGPVTCSLGIYNTAGVNAGLGSATAWTNSIHGITGNILLADGRVVLAPNSRLKQSLTPLSAQDNRTLHFLIP
jgi:type II secretory pathway pseudopilin PulG